MSAACVFALRARSRAGATPEGARRELAAGWRYVRSQPWLWATLASAALAVLFVLGPFQVLLPYLIRNELGGDAGTYGLVLALSGLGAVISAALVGQVGLGRRPISLMYAAWSVSPIALCGFAVASASWQLLPLAAAEGACLAVGNVVWSTLMQTRVPPALLGRVTSVDFLASLGLTPVSFALTAPAAATLGASTTLFAAGLFAAVAGLAFWPLALRQAPSAVRSAVKPG